MPNQNIRLPHRLRWGKRTLLALVLGLHSVLLGLPLPGAHAQGAPRFTPTGPITGKVYNDYGSDGNITTGTINDTGVQGVTVAIYDITGALRESTQTDANGNYTFAVAALDGVQGPYRVEFSNLPASYEPSRAQGTQNGTTVQFVVADTVAARTANLGVLAPCDYCQNNPRLATVLNHTGSNTIYSKAALLSQSYSNAINSTAPRTDAYNTQIGAAWGMGWQASQKRLFVSALLKRHAGLGPQGPGGVYVLDYSNSAAASLAKSLTLQGVLPANGGPAIDLGSVTRGVSVYGIWSGVDGDYQLPYDGSYPSRDLDAFSKVGKMAYGDIDVDETGNRLWLVNLKQNALIQMDISAASAQLPTSNVYQYPIVGATGIPTCPLNGSVTSGTFRPWALAFRGGLGYLGGVCDAGVSQQKSDLRGYVVSFNPNNPSAGFTVVLTIPLNYLRETAETNALNPGAAPNQDRFDTGWNPWADTWAQTLNRGYALQPRRSYAQPMVSDLEFQADGSLAIALGSRFAEQSGFENYRPISADMNVTSSQNAGDLLKACKVNGAYVFEGASGCPESDPGGTAGYPYDGINGTGEFFYGDFFISAGGGFHLETAGGALAQWPGYYTIVSTSFNPVTDIFAQGLIQLSLSSGQKASGWQLDRYVNGDADYASHFAKGNGMGDAAVLCDPAPIEIGNRVWNDVDGDGVQDAGEPGLNGVQVTLKSGTTIVATTATTGDGNYTFTNVAPNTAYAIEFSNASAGYWLTAANIEALPGGSSTSNHAILDTRDNDALLVGGVATIYYTTGSAGQNNHGLDAGFIPPTPTPAPPTPTPDCATPINLAQGKAATQSSFYTNSYNPIAAKAVDGNTSGNWTHGSVSSTLNETNAWWQVDLGNSYSLQTITLWNRTDCCSDRLSNFHVFVSNSDMTGRSFSSLLSDATVWSRYQGPQAPTMLQFPANVNGRYVRVQLAGTNILHMAEVAVSGTPICLPPTPTPTNTPIPPTATPTNTPAPPTATPAPAADLAITKSASVTSITSGVPFTYLLTVVNNGPSNAPTVVVTDLLPAGLVVNSITPSADGSCTNTSGAIRCTWAALAVGASVTVTINVTP